MKSKTTQVLIALVLGLILGLVASFSQSELMKSAIEIGAPIGKLWVNGIRMTVVPLVVSLLITGIASVPSSSAREVGGKAMKWFVILVIGSSTFTALTAPFLLQLRDFGTDMNEGLAGTDAVSQVELPAFSEWVTGLIPSNPIAAAADGAMLPLIVFSIIFGFAINQLKKEVKAQLLGFFDAIAKAMLVIVEWILIVAPIGVLFLIMPLAANAGLDLVFDMGWFLIVACGLILVALVLLYPITALFSNVSMSNFIKACLPAQAIGFSTRSSLASLPAMIEAADNTLKLPSRKSGIVLPISVALLKFASPIARGTGTFFIAYLYGIDIGFIEVMTIMAAIGALSFYSPGVPSGGLFIMTPIYIALGLPVEGIGILIALDLIPDMFITMANVTADLSVAAIVGRGD